jgi:hypothetical protein
VVYLNSEIQSSDHQEVCFLLERSGELPETYLETDGPGDTRVRTKLARFPKVPDAFRKDYAAIPSSQPVQAVLSSFQDATEGRQGWSDNESTTAPVYRYPIGKYGREGVVDISVRDGDGLASVSGGILPSLWDQVQKLNDLTGDVFLVALVQWLYEGEADNTWLSVDQILKYRGIKPKVNKAGATAFRGGHRLEDKLDIANSFEQLDSVWVELVDVEIVQSEMGRSGHIKKRARRLRLESKSIAISDRISQGELGGRYIPIAWQYKPGNWARPFLRKEFRQTALLVKRSLQYDPYREDWEKRLARYLTFHWRIEAKYANYDQPYRVGTLLAAINKEPNLRFPHRTRNRLEKALDRLQQDDVISCWEYGTWDEGTLPPKNWLPTWLKWTVQVSPPPVVFEHYKHLSKKNRKTLVSPKREGDQLLR